MGVQAVREVRTKESIKNNRLIQFVQYEKQPANRSLQYFIYSNLSSAKNNHSSLRGTVNKQTKRVAHGHSEHQGNISLMMRLPDNIGLVGLAQGQPAEYFSKQSQPLGGMPLLSSSLRSKRFIQPALLSSPSSFIAKLRRSDKLESNRNCTTILSFWCSLVDIGFFLYILDIEITNVHYCIAISKTMPRSAQTLAEHLTTMLTEVTVMASYKSTQTHPKFTDTYWIIPLDSNIPYGKVSLTRRERRLFHVLFKGDRLVWSGRKPITPQSIIACSASQRQEVAHA
nr:phage transcriptional regulator [Arsenophonus nasoniae]